MDGSYSRVQLDDSSFASAICWGDTITFRVAGGYNGCVRLNRKQVLDVIAMLDTMLDMIDNPVADEAFSE